MIPAQAAATGKKAGSSTTWVSGIKLTAMPQMVAASMVMTQAKVNQSTEPSASAPLGVTWKVLPNGRTRLASTVGNSRKVANTPTAEDNSGAYLRPTSQYMAPKWAMNTGSW